MSFLDGPFELNSTCTNVTQPQPGFDAQPAPPDHSQSPPVPKHPLQSPSMQPGPSWVYPEEVGPPSTIETDNYPFSAHLQQSPTTDTQSWVSSVSSTIKKKNYSHAGKVLNYSKNKKRKERDGVDYLFMSYAKSFKKLSVRNQSAMKVTLAKLFADAELEEFENNSTNEMRNHSPMYQSPGSSIASDESPDPILIPEKRIKQEK